MSRVYNFSAGPSMLPEPVLERAAKEMLDYKGTGISITEMSHRSKVFASVIESAENILRKLMGIPDNYSVLTRELLCSLPWSRPTLWAKTVRQTTQYGQLV